MREHRYLPAWAAFFGAMFGIGYYLHTLKSEPNYIRRSCPECGSCEVVDASENDTVKGYCGECGKEIVYGIK